MKLTITAKWQANWRWGQKRLRAGRNVVGTVTRLKNSPKRGDYFYRASGFDAKFDADTDHKTEAAAMRAVERSFR